MTAPHNCPLCGNARLPQIAAAAEQLQRLADEIAVIRASLCLPAPVSAGAILGAAAAPWVHEVAAMVAMEHNVSPHALMADIRSAPIVRPRFYLIWLLHQVGNYTTPRIGHLINRDHTSVIYAIRRVNKWRQTDDVALQHTDGLLRRAKAIRDRSQPSKASGVAA